MKKFFNRFKEKITFKELPPPYSENDIAGNAQESHEFNHSVNVTQCDVLDLIADCKIAAADDSVDQESAVEYTEIKEMGLWHSTPLAHRHKSKISLTWVLKENTKLPTEKLQNEENLNYTISSVSNQRVNQTLNENDRFRKCKSREVAERVVGRNEYYHNLRFRSACEQFVNKQDSCSDTSGTEEYAKRRHRHRRKKRTKKDGKFGYDIKDLDSFLSEASMDRPGNIPVVVAYPSTLYETRRGPQREVPLPLGTVVNAVFKNEQWLYAQTPHGEEGYVLYSACLPLGILPNRTSNQKKTPCWESSTDIYPQPCGNLTDTEKEQLRGRTRSECRYQRKSNHCAEKNFDSLYLKTKSVTNIDKIPENEVDKVKRHTLLIVNSDYKGSVANRTLTVQEGEVVVLLQGIGLEADVDSEWFYVKKKDGTQGFIPTAVAGHGYI